MTNRAGAFAVLVAFLVGMLSTLAIRPTEKAIESSQGASNTLTRSIRWRVPVAFGTNLEALGDNALYVAKTLGDTTDQAFKFDVYEPGEIVPAFNIVDAVREGKVPAGYTWLGYDQGKIPASALIGAVPFGMEPWEYTAWWYEGGGRELSEALYDKYNIHPLLCGLIGPETAGWFREPIVQLSDVEGLKIRFAGLGGKVIERLGASVTMLPGGEIFQALEKGAIDATEFSLPNVDQALGFDRIAKINYFPGWHQTYTSAHLVVGKKMWDTLTENERSLLDTVCTAGVTRNLAKAEALQGPVIKGFKSKGVEARQLPIPILRELNRIADEVIAEEAEKDLDFQIIHDSQTKFRESYAVWKRLAYLPRDF